MVDPADVGAVIALLRKGKGLTQSQLAERLNISAQAVSKWESGRALPDTALLADLACALETTADHLLNGGKATMKFNSWMSAREIMRGVTSLADLGGLIGRDNTVYEGIIAGVGARMNVDFQEMLADPFLREALFVELVIQNWRKGRYIDISEVVALLMQEHWKQIVAKYASELDVV